MPPPTTLTDVLTDRTGIERVLGRLGVDVRLDVDATSVVSAAEEAQLTFAAQYGTEFVYNRAGGRYSMTQLVNSWEVYWWASAIAAHLLSFYRVGAIPAVLQWEFERVEAILMDVMNGVYRLFSLASRSGTGVALDNMRLDPRFAYKQLRVETTISDGPRVQLSPQIRDIASQYFIEWNR